jgi:hypothetical protein
MKQFSKKTKCLLMVSVLPFCNFVQFAKTTLKTDLDETLQMPAIGICRTPAVKNESAYRHFMSMSKNINDDIELKQILDQTYFTTPEETVINLAVAKNYINAVGRPTEIKVGPPFVKTIFVDPAYSGFCVTIPTSELIKYLVAKGEVAETEKDFDLAVVVWLKVTNLLLSFFELQDSSITFFSQGSDHDNGGFFVRLHRENDNVTVGNDNIQPATSTTVPYSSVTALTLDYSLKKKIRNCDSSNALLTKCMMSYIDKLYGSGPANFTAKFFDLAQMKFNGPSRLYQRTGCRVPCEIMEFKTKVFALFHREYLLDPARHVLDAQNDTSSSILIINHVKADRISVIKEVPQYTTLTFIGDAGGIVGIFLGVSFLSIYEDLIGPLIERIQAVIK